MKVEIKLTERAKRTIAGHEKLGGRIANALKEALQRSLTDTHRFIAEEELTGQVLETRTGQLKKAIKTTDAEWKGDIVEGKIGIAEGPAERYAGILEEGGTIYPKRGKYLAIPLPAARTRRGVIKGKYNVSNLRELNMFLFKSKAGNLILAMKKKLKTKTNIIPLFVLKRSVTIQPHKYMERGAERLRRTLTAEIEKEVNRVVEN